MQNVITADQARKITNGRPVHLPIQYAEACRALGECRRLEDAKVWSDKADALAAWAKIYHDDQVAREARMLKKEAYRRIGILGRELYPSRRGKGSRADSRSPSGYVPNPGEGRWQKVQEATGLPRSHVAAALKLGSLTQKEYDALKEQAGTPLGVAQLARPCGNAMEAKVSNALNQFAFHIRSVPAAQFRRYIVAVQNGERWRMNAGILHKWLLDVRGNVDDSVDWVAELLKVKE